MRMLITFIINNLIQCICEGVDTAFGNNLGIDSICVLSSFTILTWLFIRLINLGAYAYEVTMKDAKLCFVLNIVSGVVIGFIIFCTRFILPHIFQLTEDQYSLFSKCLVVYSFGIVVKSTACFLYYYLLYSCRMKMIYVSNALYYTMLFVTDFIVVKNGYDLSALIATTAITNLVYTIGLLFASGILKTKSDFSMANIKKSVRLGVDIIFDRASSMIASIGFTCIASRLGTELYAIFSVCYSVAVMLEAYIDSLYEFSIIKLNKAYSLVNKYRTHLLIIKRYGVIISVLMFVSAFPALFLLHGAISVEDCALYLLGFFPYLVTLGLTEVSAACLASAQRTGILKFDGVIGIVVRLPVAFILFKLGAGVTGFIFAYTIDFVCRAVYNEINLKRIVKIESSCSKSNQ